MCDSRTAKFFGIFIAIYVALLLPGQFWPKYMDTPVGLIAAIPFLSIYLFHGIGIPFLLQHNGACGWGWCMPTLFGWVFLIAFWLGVTWLLAAFFANLTRPAGAPPRGSNRQ